MLTVYLYKGYDSDLQTETLGCRERERRHSRTGARSRHPYCNACFHVLTSASVHSHEALVVVAKHQQLGGGRRHGEGCRYRHRGQGGHKVLPCTQATTHAHTHSRSRMQARKPLTKLECREHSSPAPSRYSSTKHSVSFSVCIGPHRCQTGVLTVRKAVRLHGDDADGVAAPIGDVQLLVVVQEGGYGTKGGRAAGAIHVPAPAYEVGGGVRGGCIYSRRGYPEIRTIA